MNVHDVSPVQKQPIISVSVPIFYMTQKHVEKYNVTITNKVIRQKIEIGQTYITELVM